MCLNNISQKFVANKNIVCYKHFNVTRDGKLYSPYRNVRWYKRTNISSIEVLGSAVYKGLHAFVYKKDANLDKETMNSDKVIKMIIPKGATYYAGTFCGKKCYAANKMGFFKS